MVAALFAASAPTAAAGPLLDLPLPREGPARARHRAEDILARPEFRPEPRSLLQRLLDELGDLFDRIARGVGGGSPVVAWAVVGLVAVLLGLVLWRGVKALQSDPGTSGGVTLDGRRRPPSDWRAEAAAHEAAGRWRDALRCTWRATVAELAARGLVEEVPGRTTGEYRQGVARALPHAAGAFSQATSLFEDAWYAAVDVGPAETARLRALGDQVLSEARR